MSGYALARFGLGRINGAPKGPAQVPKIPKRDYFINIMLSCVAGQSQVLAVPLCSFDADSKSSGTIPLSFYINPFFSFESSEVKENITNILFVNIIT